MSQYGIDPLLVRQEDVEADREATGLLAAAVRSLHHPRAATGDHGEASPRELGADRARRLVPRRPLADPRRAEHGHGWPVDPVDRLEPGEELGGDQGHVTRKRLVTTPQQPSVEVLTLRHRRVCGTCEASIPSASSKAVPIVSAATTQASCRASSGPRPAGASPQHLPGAEDLPAVEDPDRHEVDQIEEEPGIREREQQPVVLCLPHHQQRCSCSTAGHGPRERDEHVAPWIERRVFQQHVGADERDEHRQRHARDPGASPRSSGRARARGSSATKPTPNCHPQISAYAPTEMKIPKNLIEKAPNLTTTPTSTRRGASNRARSDIRSRV